MEEEKINEYATALLIEQFKTKKEVKRLINNMFFAKQNIKGVVNEFDAYFYCSQSDLSCMQYDFGTNWNIEDERIISKAAFKMLEERKHWLPSLFSELN